MLIHLQGEKQNTLPEKVPEENFHPLELPALHLREA